jgi:hypothetical protein
MGPLSPGAFIGFTGVVNLRGRRGRRDLAAENTPADIFLLLFFFLLTRLLCLDIL